MNGEVFNSECVDTLTNTHSTRSIDFVRYGDIRTRLLQSHKDAAKRLSEIHDKQNELRSAYRHYLDLQSQAEFYETRIKRIVAALRESDDFENVDESVKRGKNVAKTISIPMAPDDVPLWEIITAILEESGELQVIELELALKTLEFETSRSAIESAIKTHKDEFRIRTSGRAKFISLKGA